MNSAFRVRLLVDLEVISKVLFTSEQPKTNKMPSCIALGTEINVLVGWLFNFCKKKKWMWWIFTSTAVNNIVEYWNKKLDN